MHWQAAGFFGCKMHGDSAAAAYVELALAIFEILAGHDGEDRVEHVTGERHPGDA